MDPLLRRQAVNKHTNQNTALLWPLAFEHIPTLAKIMVSQHYNNN